MFFRNLAFQFESMISAHLSYVAELLKTYADRNFSILITGNHGTGKTYIAQEVLKHIYSKITLIDSALYSDADYSFFTKDIKEKLSDNRNGAIIFDNIHDLDLSQQKVLFAYLQTKPDGNLSLIDTDKNRNERQFVFISTPAFIQLQHAGSFYIPLLNKISNHIIHLPDLQTLDKPMLKEAFRALWNQNQFNQPLKQNITFNEKDEHYEQIFDFISSVKLENNFHDLQKIAILIWREKFVQNRKNLDLFFNAVTQSPTEAYSGYLTAKDADYEWFEYGKPANDMIKDFRKKLTIWADKKYVNESKVRMYEILDISEKTYYNWKNNK